MGFYIRKAFRMGPVRLNLSKRGLGASAGPKGARLGLTSDGRTYTHIGRGGLYYRKYKASKRSGREGSPLSEEELGPAEPLELEEDTGLTYRSEKLEPERVPLQERLRREPRNFSKTLLFPASALILYGFGRAAVGSPAFIGQVLLFLSLLALVFWPVSAVRTIRTNRKGERLGALLARHASSRRPLGHEEQERLLEMLLDNGVTDEDKRYFAAVSYIDALRAVVEDRRITDEELAFLGQLESILKLDGDFVREARVEIFRQAYLEAASDRDLTEEEEKILAHLRKGLDITDEEIKEELETLERLKEIREIRRGRLEAVEAGIALKRGETCYLKVPARLLKSRVLRRFQRGGRKIKVTGFVLDKEGELLVTDKRILLLHEGTSSIPLGKILDVEVDYDRNLLAIARDGVRNPTYITTPDALKAGAVIAGLIGH